MCIWLKQFHLYELSTCHRSLQTQMLLNLFKNKNKMHPSLSYYDIQTDYPAKHTTHMLLFCSLLLFFSFHLLSINVF